MMNGLSEDNMLFLIEILHRLMPQSAKVNIVAAPSIQESRGIQAFRKLDAARAEIRQYLSDDFDPKRELEEARAERYGNFG